MVHLAMTIIHPAGEVTVVVVVVMVAVEVLGPSEEVGEETEWLGSELACTTSIGT